MNERIASFPTIHQVVERDGTPVALRPEFGETLPQHSDMLRYDVAFANPKQIDLVVFPVFRGKAGRGPLKITHDRWTSFGLRVEDSNEGRDDHVWDAVENIGSWITYRHENENALKELVPVSLDEWLKQHPKDKVAAWR
jgi:hypothetical protein